MVPVLSQGKSFKGAALYFLHDKKQEGETERLTTGRVGWTMTLNLPTEDAERAWRMMAHTAMTQTELKKAAGVPLTGQKLKTPVLTYSLAWHKDDRPSKEEQLLAARQTLKVLGLEGHQALIVQHTDTDHQHIHLIVNRVSPENGVAAKLKKSQTLIQDWALKYQQERGQTHCPRRLENAQKRKQGQAVFEGRDSRAVYEFKKAVSNDSLRADFVLAGLRMKDAQLYNEARAIRSSHGRQWKELQRTYEAGRAKLIQFEEQRLQQAKAAITDSHKPQWDTLLTRQAEEKRRVEAFRAVAQENGEKIAADPIIALAALTRQQATFTRQDIARFVSQNSENQQQAAAVAAKIEASPELVRLGHDENGRERFTTREMLAIEQRMKQAAGTLAERDGHAVAGGARQEALQSRPLSEEQAEALRHVTGKGDLALVVGYAGTGKSTMLGAAREVWERQGYTVKGIALSGIAAENLEAGSSIESRTIASLEYAWAKDRDHLTAKDVLVIDEAGMVDSRRMERLLSAAQDAGAKVVLVGDPSQLQAIEAGASFRALADRHGKAEIKTVRRQAEAWQRDATKELAEGQTAEALQRYRAAGMVQAHESRDGAREALVDGWNADRKAAPDKSQIILAYTREDVATLNGLARQRMRDGGELGDDATVRTEQGKRLFAQGDRVMFLRNDRGLNVKNGTLGTVERVGQGRMAVRLDGADGRTIAFDLKDYAHIDHGYASTVHKAQGVTVDKARVLASPFMDRHAAYVSMTRHREAMTLHFGRDDFADDRQLARKLGRDRAKDSTLDYQAGIVEERQRTGLKGLLCAVFNPAERRAEMDIAHKHERQDLTRRITAAFRQQAAVIRKETTQALSKLGREFQRRSEGLAETQEADRDQLKEQWRIHAADRTAELEVNQGITQTRDPSHPLSGFGSAGEGQELGWSQEQRRSLTDEFPHAPSDPGKPGQPG